MGLGVGVAGVICATTFTVSPGRRLIVVVQSAYPSRRSSTSYCPGGSGRFTGVMPFTTLLTYTVAPEGADEKERMPSTSWAGPGVAVGQGGQGVAVSTGAADQIENRLVGVRRCYDRVIGGGVESDGFHARVHG